MDVVEIQPVERVYLDPAQIEGLRRHLGRAEADDVLDRAIGVLAQRLHWLQHPQPGTAPGELRKTVRSLIAVAEQIGLKSLTLAALNVLVCIDRGDQVALAAALARLHRIWAVSVVKVGELEDLWR